MRRKKYWIFVSTTNFSTSLFVTDHHQGLDDCLILFLSATEPSLRLSRKSFVYVNQAPQKFVCLSVTFLMALREEGKASSSLNSN